MRPCRCSRKTCRPGPAAGSPMSASDKRTRRPVPTPRRSTSTTNMSRRKPVSPASAARSGRHTKRFDSAATSRGAHDHHAQPHHRSGPRQGEAAKFFARVFGLKRGRSSYFAPVKINKTLTLLFDDDSKFESHHLAFHVSNREFDAIFSRIKEANIAFGSAPWSLDDGKLNDWRGGRGLYFRDPNGHVLEIMTVPQ